MIIHINEYILAIVALVIVALYVAYKYRSSRNYKFNDLAEVRKIRPLRIVITGGSKVRTYTHCI